jgi:hypothetical protein
MYVQLLYSRISECSALNTRYREAEAELKKLSKELTHKEHSIYGGKDTVIFELGWCGRCCKIGELRSRCVCGGIRECESGNQQGSDFETFTLNHQSYMEGCLLFIIMTKKKKLSQILHRVCIASLVLSDVSLTTLMMSLNLRNVSVLLYILHSLQYP